MMQHAAIMGTIDHEHPESWIGVQQLFNAGVGWGAVARIEQDDVDPPSTSERPQIGWAIDVLYDRHVIFGCNCIANDCLQHSGHSDE